MLIHPWDGAISETWRAKAAGPDEGGVRSAA